MNAKKILLPAVALFAICLVAAALLALTYSVTADPIQVAAKKAEDDARKAVFPEAVSFSDDKTVSSYTYNEALDGDKNVIGFTFTTSAKGYGGDVKVMTGVRMDGTVRAIEILDVSNETPGLGQNAKQPKFTEQFADKQGKIGVNTASQKVDNGVDALTGATFTSRGVTNAVNLALDLFAQIPKGGAAIG